MEETELTLSGKWAPVWRCGAHVLIWFALWLLPLEGLSCLGHSVCRPWMSWYWFEWSQTLSDVALWRGFQVESCQGTEPWFSFWFLLVPGKTKNKQQQQNVFRCTQCPRELFLLVSSKSWVTLSLQLPVGLSSEWGRSLDAAPGSVFRCETSLLPTNWALQRCFL